MRANSKSHRDCFTMLSVEKGLFVRNDGTRRHPDPERSEGEGSIKRDSSAAFSGLRMTRDQNGGTDGTGTYFKLFGSMSPAQSEACPRSCG